MDTVEESLLRALGIKAFTKRHLQIVTDFLASKETDGAILLNELGSWDESDLEIVNTFLSNSSSD